MASNLLRKNISGKVSFTEFIIGISFAFIVIILAAPFISGYNLSAKDVKSDGTDVVIQNYITKLVKAGKIQVDKNLSEEKLSTELKKVMNNIPESKDKNKKYYLNKKTGKVILKNFKTDDEIMIK
jgi:hypothetical protein